MNKGAKIGLGILATTALVAITLPFAIPIDTMKQTILTRIEAATGRKVEIRKISLSVFPDIALEADDVSIGNPAWVGTGLMTDIKQLRIGVELMPLLHKQLDIKELTFDSPVITLLKNGDKANWQLEGNTPVKGSSTPATVQKVNNTQMAEFIPGYIQIKNGKLVYTDAQTGSHTVSGINVKLEAPNHAEKATINFSGNIDGKTASVDIGLKNPLALTQEKPVDINAKITFQNIEATWVGSLALINKSPSLTGKVTLPELDVTKLSGNAGSAPAKAAPAVAPQNPNHWSNEHIDLSWLNGANVDLMVAIDKLILPKTTLNNIQIATRIARGVLDVKTNDISAYDGVLKATLAVNSAGAMTASTAVSHVKAEPLLHDFAGSSKLSGTLDGEISVASQGTSQRALVSALDGVGKFGFSNGKLKGVDLGALARNIISSSTAEDNSGTDFSELSGTFTIKNGIVSNNDLKMNSPLLRVTGAGTADLPGWQVQYLLQPKLVASAHGQGGKDMAGITVPVKVEGPLDKPHYHPDLQAAIKSNLADPTKLKNTVNQFKGNLGDKLQNLLR